MQLPNHTCACRGTGAVTDPVAAAVLLQSRGRCELCWGCAVLYCSSFTCWDRGISVEFTLWRTQGWAAGPAHGARMKDKLGSFKLLSATGELYQLGGSAYQGNVQAAGAAACRQKGDLSVPRDWNPSCSQHWGCPSAAQATVGTKGHWVSLLSPGDAESWAACVWELFPVDLEIKEIITGKSCSGFICLGLEVKLCGSSRFHVLAVNVSSVYQNQGVGCHHLCFRKGCEALESVTSLFLLLKRAGFTAPTHAKDVEGQTHTLKGK